MKVIIKTALALGLTPLAGCVGFGGEGVDRRGPLG